MEIVDIHPHVIASDNERYPFAPLGGTLSAWARERPVDAAGMLAEMDAAGIRRAVLVQAATAYGYDNTYAADSAAAHPGRFLFAGIIDVLAPGAATVIEQLVRDRRMAGFRIFSDGSTLDTWLEDPVTYGAWEAARALGITICLQTGFESLAILGRMLARFPDVNVVLDHCAWPPVDDGPPYVAAEPFFALADHPNLYLKLTEALLRDLDDGRSTSQAFLEALVTRFGAQRIAWGSNYPSSAGPLVRLRDLAFERLAFLSDADRHAILCDTAVTLYPQLQAM
jgi:predicted TIM-barrel fold metal-dependent hydrolase